MKYRDSVIIMAHRPTKDWWTGLIMGLMLGIIGNLFTSYLMKYFDALGIEPWIWGVSALFIFAALVFLIWRFWKEAQKAASGS